ncbi:MAG TPA: hypothetical protein VGE06_05310, partial [Flavisolibacter sp.]
MAACTGAERPGSGKKTDRQLVRTAAYLCPMPWNWSDSLNLFGKLTPRRALNAAKVLASYQVSKWTQKP